jgi:hypothetical protein
VGNSRLPACCHWAEPLLERPARLAKVEAGVIDQPSFISVRPACSYSPLPSARPMPGCSSQWPRGGHRPAGPDRRPGAGSGSLWRQRRLPALAEVEGQLAGHRRQPRGVERLHRPRRPGVEVLPARRESGVDHLLDLVVVEGIIAAQDAAALVDEPPPQEHVQRFEGRLLALPPGGVEQVKVELAAEHGGHRQGLPGLPRRGGGPGPGWLR